MVYNGYYKVMSNIRKMGQLPTPDYSLNQPFKPPAAPSFSMALEGNRGHRGDEKNTRRRHRHVKPRHV